MDTTEYKKISELDFIDKNMKIGLIYSQISIILFIGMVTATGVVLTLMFSPSYVFIAISPIWLLGLYINFYIVQEHIRYGRFKEKTTGFKVMASFLIIFGLGSGIFLLKGSFIN